MDGAAADREYIDRVWVDILCHVGCRLVSSDIDLVVVVVDVVLLDGRPVGLRLRMCSSLIRRIAWPVDGGDGVRLWLGRWSSSCMCVGSSWDGSA